MNKHFSRELSSILYLSIGFTILIAVEDVFKNIQKVIVSSIADDKPGFEAEGYTLTGIKYTVFCLSIWFGPYLSYSVGPRPTLVISSLGFVYYIASFATESEWALYSAVVILGIGEGTVAPVEAQYVSEASTKENVSRNVCIFFALNKILLLLGNIFVYFAFHGKQYINQETRRVTIYTLSGAMLASTTAFIFLPKTTGGSSKKDYSLFEVIKNCWNLFVLPDILFLLLACSYVGLQMSFRDGIYSPSIGFTLAFGGDAKELVALSGIIMSFGGLAGVLFPMLFVKCIKRQSYVRRFSFLFATIAELTAFLITFINLPNSANFGNTHDVSFIQPNVFLAMTSSLLLSFADSCLYSQIFAFFADFYNDKSGEGAVLSKFVRNIFVAISYYCCSHLGLHTQLGILSVMAVVGAAAYFFAEHISESASIVKQEELKNRKKQTRETVTSQ